MSVGFAAWIDFLLNICDWFLACFTCGVKLLAYTCCVYVFCALLILWVLLLCVAYLLSHLFYVCVCPCHKMTRWVVYECTVYYVFHLNISFHCFCASESILPFAQFFIDCLLCIMLHKITFWFSCNFLDLQSLSSQVQEASLCKNYAVESN